MTHPEQYLDHLWKLQEAFSRNLQGVADCMADVAIAGIQLQQSRWDELFAAWDRAFRQLDAVTKELGRIYGV